MVGQLMERADDLELRLAEARTHIDELNRWIGAAFANCPECDEPGSLRPHPLDGSTEGPILAELPRLSVDCNKCGSILEFNATEMERVTP